MEMIDISGSFPYYKNAGFLRMEERNKGKRSGLHKYLIRKVLTYMLRVVIINL